jgi:hypothetical protein
VELGERFAVEGAMVHLPCHRRVEEDDPVPAGHIGEQRAAADQDAVHRGQAAGAAVLEEEGSC